MSELLSYSLSDLLMFSAHTYARLFELYHRALWPAHLPVALLSLWLIAATQHASPRQARLISMLLTIAWATLAGLFFLRHYATIQLAAPWFAMGFALQALLLLILGALSGKLHYDAWRDSRSAHVGLLLLLIAIFIVPLGSLLAGRSWQGIELFGLTPDATALGTIGLVLMTASRYRWLLLPLPLLWCLISLLTYLAMAQKLG